VTIGVVTGAPSGIPSTLWSVGIAAGRVAPGWSIARIERVLDVSKRKNNPKLLHVVELEHGELPSNYAYRVGRLVCSDGVSRFGLSLVCLCCGDTSSAVYDTREQVYEVLDQAAKELAAAAELVEVLNNVGVRRRVS
jgi:hypothetical protein